MKLVRATVAVEMPSEARVKVEGATVAVEGVVGEGRAGGSRLRARRRQGEGRRG